jgi:hypothetical protein
MEVSIKVIDFWDMTRCNCVEWYQRFGRISCFYLQSIRGKDGCSRFLRNASIFIPIYIEISHKTTNLTNILFSVNFLICSLKSTKMDTIFSLEGLLEIMN